MHTVAGGLNYTKGEEPMRATNQDSILREAKNKARPHILFAGMQYW
jgi:hypothetical protein